MPTGRGLLFGLVADKLDLFSAERRLAKELCSFYCVLYNKSMYVMALKDSNASRQMSATVYLRSILIFDLLTFPCFTRVSEGYFMPCYQEKWKLYT